MYLLERAVDLVVETSWRTSFVFLGFIVIRRLVRRQLPARFLFLGWVVLGARMLLPFEMPVRWRPLAWSQPLTIISPGLGYSQFSLPEHPSTATTAPKLMLAQQGESRAELPPPILVPPHWTDWKRAFGALWVAGIVCILISRLARIFVFRGTLRRSRQAPDERLVRIAADCARALGIRGSLEIALTPAIEAPAMYGSRRPRLLFPLGFADKLTELELQLILLHELGHWRRGDLYAHWVLWTARLIHWFNPLVWVTARWARLDCELACDQFVMRKTSAVEARAYGAVILKVLGLVQEQAVPPSVLGIFENKQQIKERIQMIASYKSASVGRIVLGGILLGALTIVSNTRETRAQEITENHSTGKTASLPSGWLKIGNGADSYLVGLDRTESHLKPSSVFIKSRDSSRREDFGGLVQVCSAEIYRGKKIRLSAWIKTAGVSGSAHLLLRADGSSGVLCFDDLGSLAPTGSTPWTYSSAVLDVPEGAVSLAYGLFLKEKGEAWFNNLVFEEVETDEEEADRALQDYRSKYNMATMEENKSVLLRKIGLLGTNIVTSELDQAHLRTTLQGIDDYLNKNKDVLEIGAIRTFGNVSSLKTELDDLKAQRGILADKYTESHPKMVENGLTIMGVKKRLKGNLDLAVADLREQYSTAAQYESRLRGELSTAQEKAREFDKIANDYKSLVRMVETKKATIQRTIESNPKQIATGAVAVELPSADRKYPENLDLE